MMLDLATVRASLDDQGIAWAVSYLAEMGSTNAQLAIAAREGASEGIVLVCGHQTAGRGRQGRRWHDRVDCDLLLSLLLRPDWPPSDYGLLSLLASVAVIEALDELTGNGFQAKWPNDVMHQGRKVAGILTEANSGAGWAVIGIGVNLLGSADSLPPDLHGSATTVEAATRQAVARERLLAAVLNAIARQYQQVSRDGPMRLVESYRQVEMLTGRQVRLLRGRETLEGVAEQIDDGGRLVIVAENGRIVADAGEVHLLK